MISIAPNVQSITPPWRASRALLMGALLIFSCKPAATTSDVGIDGPKGLDAGKDSSQPDIYSPPDQTPPDTLPWDSNSWDFWVGDAALSPTKILYATSSDPAALGLLTIDTAGGGPTPVPGWSGYVAFDPLSLAGPQEYVPFSPHLPRTLGNLNLAFQGIGLPEGVGTLYYYHKKLVGVSGLLLIRTTGELEIMLEVPGIYADTLSPTIALTPTGDVGAAIYAKHTVLLFRTDRTLFPSGKNWSDLTNPTLELEEVYARSLTLVGGWLYCVARDTSGIKHVLRAPADGTALLTKVTLPQINGADSLVLATQFARNALGQLLALPAGPQASQQDLMIIHAQSGVANRVMASPGPIAEPGDTFGYQESLLALSPQGTRVAYLQGNANAPELYEAPTDGSGGAIQISSSQRFQNEVTSMNNLFWSDEDTLYFMAGTSTSQLSLFRWDVKLAILTKIMGEGLALPTFNGQGTFSPRGGWISPNQKWLYWILYDSTDLSQNIMGIDLIGRTTKKITDKIQVQTTPGSLVACASSGQLYFSAKTRIQVNESDIWGFDQNAGQTALRLTRMNVTPTNSWYVFDLTLSPDCSWLTWSAGRSTGQRGVWTLQTGGPLVARKSTLVPSYITPSFYFSTDQSSLFYGSGGALESSSLKGLPLKGGQPTTLDSMAGYFNIFAVY